MPLDPKRDCKIKKRKLNQMQQFYVAGKVGSFYELFDQLNHLASSPQVFADYMNALPERSAEDVLKDKEEKS